MMRIGIVGNGPRELLPDLSAFSNDINYWIAADGGAVSLIEANIPIYLSVGDFDSISPKEKQVIHEVSDKVIQYPREKDKTDLELAIDEALHLEPSEIFLFGTTGGRLDHELMNIQFLHSIVKENIRSVIIDKNNQLEFTLPGKHMIQKNTMYPNISFIPCTKEVTGLTLDGFYYPLHDKTISFGSSLSVSNKLLSNNGTFFYKEGILLVIKSRDI